MSRFLQRFVDDNACTLSRLRQRLEAWLHACEDNSFAQQPWRGTSGHGLISIAVGMEYSYPYIAIYDYEQFFAAYMLALWMERELGNGQQVGVTFVGSDCAEVNRYNVNPVFRDYFRERGALANVVADLEVEPTICVSKCVEDPNYLSALDRIALLRELERIEKATAYITLIQRVKLELLRNMEPFDSPDFGRRVGFANYPIGAFCGDAHEELGTLLDGIRTVSSGATDNNPMQIYRIATGKVASVSNRLSDDPFIAVCPRCGAGSVRVIESHYRPRERTLHYRCRAGRQSLYPNYTSRTADTVNGCGFKYSVLAGVPGYYLDPSGRPTGYPRFALASVVARWPVWVMESTDVISGGLLRSMTGLRVAYQRGLLGCSPQSAPPMEFVCCGGRWVGRAKDCTVSYLEAAAVQELQRSARVSVFEPAFRTRGHPG